MTMSLRTTTRNTALAVITTDIGGSCYIRIYDGTKPANVGTAITTQVLLAELRGNATFAPAPSGGVLTLNAITADTSADASGTATWARFLKSDGTTAIFDVSVGVTGADINFNTTTFVLGANVAISALTITDGNP